MSYTSQNRLILRHPAGENKKLFLRVNFDRRLKLEFHGSKITSDGGFLTYRELDDALFLTDAGGDVFDDGRTGKCPSSKHSGLLSLYSNGGSGSFWIDVKPLGVDGSSGGSGWSVS